MPKIGLIFPTSRSYPLLGYDFTDGVRLGFKEENLNAELLIEDVGMGASLDVIQEKTRKVLLQGRADMLFLFSEARLVEPLFPIFEQLKKPTFIIDLGAKIAAPSQALPFIYYNSYHLWQSLFLTGHLLGSQYRKVGYCSSFYDCGYDLGYCFGQGVSVGGGEQVFTFINRSPDLTKLASFIEQGGPQAIGSMHSGQEASAFIRYYKASGFHEKIALMVSPFALEDSNLTEMGEAALGIRSIASWSPNLAHEANRQFIQNYTAETSRQPNVFSLLGYETAKLSGRAISQNGGRINIELGPLLKQTSLDSPRGLIRVDEYQVIQPPHYLREVNVPDKSPANEIISELETLPLQKFEKPQGPISSGWLNPYLCV